MSRTIRRTKTTKPHSRLEKQYTHKPLDQWLDVASRPTYQFNGIPVRKLEGAAFDRVYWRFHTDNGRRDFGFENCFERPQHRPSGEVRALYKQQLFRSLLADPHEIILQGSKDFWEFP